MRWTAFGGESTLDGNAGEEVVVSSRVNALEAGHQAALAAHADAWAERALTTEPVDWTRWEAAVRACYHDAGVRWPGLVVHVASPLALARALVLARVNEVPGDEDRALVGLLRRTIQGRVERAIARLFAPGVAGLVQRSVHLPVDAAVGGTAVAQAVDETLYARL